VDIRFWDAGIGAGDLAHLTKLAGNYAALGCGQVKVSD